MCVPALCFEIEKLKNQIQGKPLEPQQLQRLLQGQRSAAAASFIWGLWWSPMNVKRNVDSLAVLILAWADTLHCTTQRYTRPGATTTASC